MDNSSIKTGKGHNILTELAEGNSELGEAFALVLNDMVVQSGITNPKAEPFEIVPPSWFALAKSPDKTPDDIKKLDDVLFEELNVLAQSYLLFIAKEAKNRTGVINYQEYEMFMLKHRFGRYTSMNYNKYLDEVKVFIKIAFDKISACGFMGDDKLIDKYDMETFLYALITKSDRTEDQVFKGFKIDGILKPFDYAVSESLLFEDRENLFTIKLNVAKEVLKQRMEGEK